MHIPDGFISNGINAAGFGISVVTVGFALRRAGHSMREERIPLLGVTAAFIFAAQMLNFPIGAGTSGHFLGATLAAILLGPLDACLVMALVLTVQCFLFADGGLTALGTNILNMGVLGTFSAYGVFRGAYSLFPRTRSGFLCAAGVASWCSVTAVSAACAAELAISGTVPLAIVFPAMVGIHGLIGVGELIITAAALSVIRAARPELIPWLAVSAPTKCTEEPAS